MPRPIDADKLKKDVLDLPDCYNGFSDTYDKAMILALVDEQPTVDAVEVVRCKDCKWHEYEEAGMVYCPNMVGSWVGEDGYCSGGERRKDGTD